MFVLQGAWLSQDKKKRSLQQQPSHATACSLAPSQNYVCSLCPSSSGDEEMLPASDVDGYIFEGGDPWAAASSSCSKLTDEAAEAAKVPVPPDRGAVKTLVLKKKPASHRCPMVDSPSLGRIKLQFAREKIIHRCAGWSVEVARRNT